MTPQLREVERYIKEHEEPRTLHSQPAWPRTSLPAPRIQNEARKYYVPQSYVDNGYAVVVAMEMKLVMVVVLVFLVAG